MKKILTFLILIISGISFAFAENQEMETQRYVVSNKDGKARFIQVEKAGDIWQYAKPREDIYIDNGIEIEGFEVTDHNFTDKDKPGILFQYEGNYYKVINPKKDVKPVDENGEVTTGLGIRNYLSNTMLGNFYRTSTPGLVALICALISGLFLIISIFKDPVPVFIRWMFAIPLCVVSLLEVGAAFSLGTDAAWWVNPDDVGYWIATPLLIPYALVAALMVFSCKLYNVVGKVDDPANVFIMVLLVIGTVLTVISAIFVVINFLFAACLLIFAGWVFSGVSYKDNKGNTITSGPLGKYKTDSHGNSTRIE